jgi:small subunit ribosomal protein S35
MSCESFETQTQNKRYLGDLVEKLIAEAKNPNADSFADVPLDTRHHVPKPFHKFPERWKLTPERRKALEEKRRAVLEEEEAKRQGGELVDGVGVIENAMKRLGLREMLEERQQQQGGDGGKGGKRGVPVQQRARVPVRGRVGQGAAPGAGPRRF